MNSDDPRLEHGWIYSLHWSLTPLLLSTGKIQPLERCNLGSHRRSRWPRLQICPLCTCRSLPAYSDHLCPKERCPIWDPWMEKKKTYSYWGILIQQKKKEKKKSLKVFHFCRDKWLLRTVKCLCCVDMRGCLAINWQSGNVCDMSVWPLWLPSRKNVSRINILFTWKTRLGFILFVSWQAHVNRCLASSQVKHFMVLRF